MALITSNCGLIRRGRNRGGRLGQVEAARPDRVLTGTLPVDHPAPGESEDSRPGHRGQQTRPKPAGACLRECARKDSVFQPDRSGQGQGGQGGQGQAAWPAPTAAVRACRQQRQDRGAGAKWVFRAPGRLNALWLPWPVMLAVCGLVLLHYRSHACIGRGVRGVRTPAGDPPFLTPLAALEYALEDDAFTPRKTVNDSTSVLRSRP